MSKNSEQLKLKYAVILAMTLPLLASLVYFVLFKESIFAQITYSGTKVFTLIWPFVVYKFILKSNVPSIPISVCTKRILFEGLVSGIAIATLTVILANTILAGVLESAAPQIITKVDDLGLREHYIPFSIFLSFAHSLLEEYYWRWFVFGTLIGLTSKYKAHLLAALAFTSHHVVILSQFFPFNWAITLSIAVVIGGVLWSWMYYRHNSLLGVWISHTFADIGILTVGYQVISG